MKKDIYKNKPNTKKVAYYPIDRPAVDTAKKSIDDVKSQLSEVEKKLSQVEEISKRLAPTVTVEMPEVQKVEVTNQTPKVDFPEVQAVEVKNFPEQKDIVFPEVQKVEVTNPEKIEFPNIQNVRVLNPTEFNFPVGEGDIPGKADPERYVPVRLTNGKRFYESMSEAFVSASKTVFPFVDVNGKPKPVQLDANGNLPTAASASITTTSGSPLFVFTVNEPSIRQVYVTNPSSATVTTTSGSPLDVSIRNLPTVQTVNVQSHPNVTSISGSLHAVVDNFPTIQRVYVDNPSSATVTTTSGTPLDVTIRNFPTNYTVNVQSAPLTTVTGTQVVRGSTSAGQTAVDAPILMGGLDGSGKVRALSTDTAGVATVNLGNVAIGTFGNNDDTSAGLTSGLFFAENTIYDPNRGSWQRWRGDSTNGAYVQMPKGTTVSGSVTTISGSQMDIKNFPTVQTVNVQNMPNVTTTSGSVVDIKNFPTVQTVNVQNMPNVTVSSLPNVTTASGSVVDIKNFPTIQTVVVKNQVDLTVSGTNHTVIDNFPTIQRVYVDNPSSATVTTTSGSPLFTYQTNIPTVQSVFVTNPSSATVTTTSGTPLDVTVRNIPTVQTIQGNVSVKTVNGNDVTSIEGTSYATAYGIMAMGRNNSNVATTLRTTSNGELNTNQYLLNGSVIDTNAGNASAGTQRVIIATDQPRLAIGLPVTTQSGSVTTTLSGSKTDIQNFPTVQTVSVQNLPNIAGSVTTLSGSQVDIKNFPTVQTVNVQNSITTASGSKVDIQNFPTIQSVQTRDASGVLTGTPTNPITISGSTVNYLNKTLLTQGFSVAASRNIVEAVSNKKIRVYAYKFVVSAALSANFRDGATSAIEGAQSFAANSGASETILPPAYLFSTSSSNALALTISGSGTVAGRVSYFLED